MRSAYVLALVVPVVALACSSSTAPEATPPPKPTPAPVASDVVPAATVTATASAPPQALVASPTPATGPTNCPENMVLVEGDYCTEIEEHKCKKEWWAEANKKRVCEEFESTKPKCTGKIVKKRYCIDKYEYPNQAGVRPEVMNRFHQAQVKCAALGKRMCSESEWNFACEGPDTKPFPYGYKRDPYKCNGDHLWDDPDMKLVEKRDPKELARLWKGVPSGSQPDCISDFGVHDMPANADEVVATEQSKNGNRGEFDSIHTGGPWYSGVRNQCRPKVYTHGEDFYYYFLSFRCCAEPDGKPTDPRTARQISDGWKIEKVERLAQFTVEQMKEKNELKKQGKCECKATDILCKTMCGTLLGPDAKDATKDSPRARYAGKKLKGEVPAATVEGDKKKKKK
ncbi:MAG: SUMF1/EgtB/PvdO family nonheme iron enzyme [Polyangiaceae bacterium]|jgi:sulfatase modifying factor 1|nr:SUMF1/EgtB/PvdO family nonheme iron enzyme [Polyangiaceae bacterium]